ncbi:LysR family transcriptional regulator [Nocardia thailandica]|uniref:LysR family transcriptional regulator n=1 Tax=Nocardia thailandica TaxID=257275 RepID=A0ABW6PN29_9NOCA
MLDVRRLRLLRELAHHGTIAAAAEAVNYTASAVSQQLAALEREAGVPLLERTGRRVALTPAARTLVAHTERVLAVLAQAEAELAAARAQLTGTLRIGAYPTAARTLVSPALVTLATAHPALELAVIETDPADVASALRADSLDVALTHEYDYVPAAADPGLDIDSLGTETLYLAAPARGEVAATAAPATIESLPAHREAPWIAGTPGTLCHTMTVRTCQAAGFTPRIRHHADDFGTVLALVAAGQGVAIVPEAALDGPPAGVALTALPTRRHLGLAYRRGTGAHPIVAAARAALRAAAGAAD